MSGPAYHGRTHRPGGTDPIDFTGTGVGSGPFFSVSSYVTIPSGTGPLTSIDWSAGGGIYTNDGGVQTVNAPNATFSGSYYSADYATKPLEPFRILQTGTYRVFSRYEINYGAPANATFNMTMSAMTLSSAGFAILEGFTIDYRKFATADNVFFSPFWVYTQHLIYVSGPPVYWNVDVGHTAGSLSGGNPSSAAVFVHRLGDS